MSGIKDSFEFVSLVAAIADDKKAQDIIVLDFRGISILYDFSVIVSAVTRIQTRAIARAIDAHVKKMNLPRRTIQGMPAGSWILMDYGGVVIHIFMERIRTFYDLEELWKDIPRLDPHELKLPEDYSLDGAEPESLLEENEDNKHGETGD